jgi:hypothetical protein
MVVEWWRKKKVVMVVVEMIHVRGKEREERN